MLEDKTLNLIFALVTGHVGTQNQGNFVDRVWDFEPGVKFFTEIYLREMETRHRNTLFPEDYNEQASFSFHPACWWMNKSDSLPWNWAKTHKRSK